ncbi:hypothetical protein SEA_LEONARD_7 [Gordonia phage Leonard]|uniref:DUF1508 domain-containing protein n=2 Tax=Leonardvirus TaxID=2948800 RepID=A0A649VMU3_9CAUD|nr:hypothetical protein BI045_gp07 [Gordonia phage Phinally]YP_010002226.1 hypothetical protein J1769_gp07 [Gordonia phage Leonard]YP_010002482.1 hypothetical protein J1772_gp05 [Gordonia phage Ali17]AMS02999.1 hypothetical protein SEA_PHINALLY_7 [Gordonia phage Phinally]AXQ60621.1 hypothetical protein SEA_ALI17_5 [Gordonia phage Ali17]QGJ93369.1 hypothetical protein SEA_LEONARD_7 [Gordonia phage Leonard]
MIIQRDPGTQNRGTIEVYPSSYFDHDRGHIVREWRFRTMSKNGKKVGYGEGFNRRAGAIHSVDAQYSLRMSATSTDEVGEIFTKAALDQPEPLETLFVLPWRLVVFKRDQTVDYVGAVY